MLQKITILVTDVNTNTVIQQDTVLYCREDRTMPL